MKLADLFNTEGLTLRPRSIKKTKAKKSGCRVSQNKNKGELLRTRFAFYGDAADKLKAFKYATYAIGKDGYEINFFCSDEKPEDAVVYTLQHQDNSVFFSASPQDKKEEKHIRRNWAGKTSPVVAVAEANGAVQFVMKRSTVQEAPDEVPDNEG